MLRCLICPLESIDVLYDKDLVPGIETDGFSTLFGLFLAEAAKNTQSGFDSGPKAPRAFYLT